MRGQGVLLLIIVSQIFGGFSNAHSDTPAFFITPRQLISSGDALEGQRIKMEVAFAYRASIQQDSGYQECTMEGKFRETQLSIDRVVLYRIYVPNPIFIRQILCFQPGGHLTVTGKVADIDGPFTKVLVEEVESGWESDRSKISQDTMPEQKPSLKDTLVPSVPKDTLGENRDSTIFPLRSKTDSSSQKKASDSSWVK